MLTVNEHIPVAFKVKSEWLLMSNTGTLKYTSYKNSKNSVYPHIFVLCQCVVYLVHWLFTIIIIAKICNDTWNLGLIPVPTFLKLFFIQKDPSPVITEAHEVWVQLLARDACSGRWNTGVQELQRPSLALPPLTISPGTDGDSQNESVNPSHIARKLGLPVKIDCTAANVGVHW